MKRSICIVILLAAFWGSIAQADVFLMPDGFVSLAVVPVGNAGNTADTNGLGSASSTYVLGKFEITAAQYCEFLNSVAAIDTYGLYNPDMFDHPYGCKIERTVTSGGYTYSVHQDWANRPVNFISWADAARFCNWLHNGQPTGQQDLSTTEDGSYYLDGAVTDAELLQAVRQTDATWTIPTPDQWHKAAYHKNDGSSGNYWLYTTASDIAPGNVLNDPDSGNSANYYLDGYTLAWPYCTTPVGAFSESPSAYGSFDQGGNLREWNDAIVLNDYMATQGGCFQDGDSRKPGLTAELPTHESPLIGMRVAREIDIYQPVQYVVNSLEDTIAPDGLLTLREAITASNLHCPINEAAAGSWSPLIDTVTFDPQLFTGGPRTIYLNGTKLGITADINISGPGESLLTIDAQRNSEVYEISGEINVKLSDHTITRGYSYHRATGGGLANYNANTELNRMTLTDNEAYHVMAGWGGAIANASGGTMQITDCIIVGNICKDGGGGGIYNGSVMRIENSEISYNQGYESAGIQNYGDLYMDNCIVEGNTGQLANIYSRGNMVVHNCQFLRNNPSAIEHKSSMLKIYNSIFVANGSSSEMVIEKDAQLYGVTLYSKANAGIRVESGQLELNHCIVTNTTNNSVNFTYSGSDNVIDTSPHFVRNPSPGADGVWNTEDDDNGDLRLRPDSPAIDSGGTSYPIDENASPILTDIRGQNRLKNGYLDAGAYEYQDLCADADGDEFVCLDDFIILKQNYGLTPNATKANGDFNGDGTVNLDDFIILKQNYGLSLE